MEQTSSITGHVDPAGSAPWAMQLVVHAPKVDAPSTSAVCEAAAIATVALLGDARAADPDGPWRPSVQRWLDGRIRKIVRRARGSRWDAVRDLGDGVTVTHRGASVRAFVPGPVDGVDPLLSKLQVSGLVLDDEPTTSPDDVPTDAVTVAVNPRLGLDEHPGKAAAQCAHGAQLAAMRMEPQRYDAWRAAGWPLAVIWPDEGSWDRMEADAPVVVTDAGFTVVAPGSRTVAATWR